MPFFAPMVRTIGLSKDASLHEMYLVMAAFYSDP
jgi:hypothetical protein